MEMLVLKRRINQSIMIGSAKVSVCSVKGGVVTLGIDAPNDTQIMRTEIIDAWQRLERAVDKSLTNGGKSDA
jgi:carbon storage regulator CsrA